VATFLGEHPEIQTVRIEGHTSDEGTDEYNLDLSTRRARAVVDALVQRGIPRDRLIYEGHGERDPLFANDSDPHRAENRRVEFHIVSE
jgi:outer membrane protein OmpA-like peptidoglycan-associated protein